MKQKLTRALIDEIRKEMPVLTEMEMRCCNGGDGGTVSWDCLFNCMNAIDPSRSAQEYAKEYADRYNLDPNTMGGVPENYINDVLTTLGFNNVPTNSMTPSREYHQIVAIEIMMALLMLSFFHLLWMRMEISFTTIQRLIPVVYKPINLILLGYIELVDLI